jgi:branched-chain amino acid transport system substrate-binding protein
MRVTFLGSDGWDSPQLYTDVSREAIKGNYYVSHFTSNDNDPKIRDFVQRFQIKYNHLPSSYAAMGYDAVMLIADAFKRAKTSLPASMNRALASAQNVKSLMGNLTMTGQRDALKGLSIMSTSTEGPKFKTRLYLSSSEVPKAGAQ